MRNVILRHCVGPLCNGKVFGCSVESVKIECKLCTQSHNCLYKDIKDYQHTLCDKCMEALGNDPKAITEACKKLKR